MKRTLKLYVYTQKTILKLTQLQKVRFIKVNELKLTEVELFSFFHFKCVAANVYELFCMTDLAISELFVCNSNLSF